MRRFILVLMLALLPLRGWVGDAMALELASVATAPMHVAMDSAAPQQPENLMHADCPGHADAASTKMPVQESADCGGCSSCQICHSVALTVALPQLPALRLPSARPQAASTFFASAERAAGFKPPIS